MASRCKETWPDGGVDAGPDNPTARCVLPRGHEGRHSLSEQATDAPPFVRSLSSGLETTGEALELTPERAAELRAALDDIERARAAAAASAGSYIVHS